MLSISFDRAVGERTSCGERMIFANSSSSLVINIFIYYQFKNMSHKEDKNQSEIANHKII